MNTGILSLRGGKVTSLRNVANPTYLYIGESTGKSVGYVRGYGTIEKGGTIRLVLNSKTREILVVGAVLRVFDVYDDVASALAGF